MNSPLLRLCYGAAIVAMATYAYMTLQGPRGLRALLDTRTGITNMEKSNTKLARENEQERDYIRRLETDRTVQEKVIEEQMQLVHPEDHVFITGPPPAK